MLQHVFDPPPDHLAAPWSFLGGLAGAALAGTLASAAAAAFAIRRLPLGRILRAIRRKLTTINSPPGRRC